MATTHVDTVTLEIIENTLRMVRHEMDAVMFRASISPNRNSALAPAGRDAMMRCRFCL